MSDTKIDTHNVLYISTVYRLGTASLALTCDALWGEFIDRVTSKRLRVRIPLGDTCNTFTERYDLLHFRASESIHGRPKNSVLMRGITHEAHRQWITDNKRILLRATTGSGASIQASPEYVMDIRPDNNHSVVISDILLPKISHVARVDRYAELMLSERSTVATYAELIDSPLHDSLFPSFE